MLGVEASVVIPHTIIFCERTLKVFLESILKFNKTWKQIILTDVSGGSDHRIKDMTEIFKNIQKADKGNLLEYNIFGVVDICGKESEWKKTLGDKLIVLNDTELERLFDLEKVNKFLAKEALPDWEKTQYPEFAKNYCKQKEVSDKIETRMM
jgi:hypothetical protein